MTGDKLPTVTDLQLAELLTVAAKRGKRLDRISRVTQNVEKKNLIQWRAPLCYDLTPLGLQVLAANNHRLRA